MPQKTRKEKQAAELHKKLKFLNDQKRSVTITLPPSVSELEKKIVTQAQPTVDRVVPHSDESLFPLRTYFFIDLKKSLLFIAAIVALEISLYYASINHYLPMFLNR